MKLSTSYIYEQLQTRYGIGKTAGLSGTDGCLRPFFGSGRGMERSGHVCVEDVGRLQKLRVADLAREWMGGKGMFLVICGEGEFPETLLEQYVQLLPKEGEVIDAQEVMNFLQSVFDRCDEWKEEMETLYRRGGTLQKLLERAAAFLGNPLTVMGLDFSLDAEAGTETLPEKARLYGPEGINMELINALMQDRQYQELQNAVEPVMFPAYISGQRTLNVNLFPEGQPVHRLVVTEFGRSVTPGDVCLVKLLAGYLEGMLSHAQGISSTDGLEQIFERILTDRTADYVEVSKQLSRLGWSSSHAYLCLILQITYVDQKRLTTKAICQYIRKQFPDSTSFYFREEIVTFFNLTRLELDRETVARKLTYFIRDSFLKAGYSRAMEGHMNLRRQYIQASTALDVGSRKKPYLWIHHFNQVAMTYILEQSTRKLPGNMLCHERLLELKRMDEEHGTEYMVTLKTYLDQNLNATKTANLLFIHRSTFLYRLDRIKSILQSDLEKPDEIFYLNLSFRLLEQEAEKD